MTGPSAIELIRQADLSGLPDIAKLEDERLQVLWLLAAAQMTEEIRYLTAAQISDALRELFQVSVSRQKVAAILSGEKKTVARIKSNGQRSFQIMRPGRTEVAAIQAGVVFVDPAKALSSLREAQAVLRSVNGRVSICDPYVDSRTVDFFVDMNGATSIRLLTSHVDKMSAFKRDISAFAAQHGVGVDVKLANARLLHDRYIIHDSGMLLVGASLNGFGRKQSFVVNVGDDVRDATLAAFDSYWAGASPV